MPTPWDQELARLIRLHDAVDTLAGEKCIHLGTGDRIAFLIHDRA
jgi:hypothetical protein